MFPFLLSPKIGIITLNGKENALSKIYPSTVIEIFLMWSHSLILLHGGMILGLVLVTPPRECASCITHHHIALIAVHNSHFTGIQLGIKFSIRALSPKILISSMGSWNHFGIEGLVT